MKAAKCHWPPFSAKPLSSRGKRFIRITAATVPARMKGVRWPSFRLRQRSDSVPKKGSRKRARILSRAITAPARDSFMWKVSRRIRGMTLSYICQKAQMERKARPTRTVRLLLSFIRGSLTSFAVGSPPGENSARKSRERREYKNIKYIISRRNAKCTNFFREGRPLREKAPDGSGEGTEMAGRGGIFPVFVKI